MAPEDTARRDRPLRADPLIGTGTTDVLDRGEAPVAPSLEAARRAARRPSAQLPDLRRAGAATDRLKGWAAAAPLRQFVGGGALCLVGIGLMLGWVIHISWTPLLDVGLLVIGAVLVVQSRRSATARPLIALGVVLALVSVATRQADVTLDGGLGRRREAPPVSLAGAYEYRLGTGQLTIDLRQTTFTTAPLEIDAEVGVGRIVVRVPADAVVTTRAVAGGGQVLVFGERHVGPGLDEAASSPAFSNKKIDLELRVGVGSVEVDRG